MFFFVIIRLYIFDLFELVFHQFSTIFFISREVKRVVFCQQSCILSLKRIPMFNCQVQIGSSVDEQPLPSSRHVKNLSAYLPTYCVTVYTQI